MKLKRLIECLRPVTIDSKAHFAFVVIYIIKSVCMTVIMHPSMTYIGAKAHATTPHSVPDTYYLLIPILVRSLFIYP